MIHHVIDSSDVFNSISDSGLISTGSLTSRLPSLIFFCSSFSLSFKSSSLSLSSSSFILLNHFEEFDNSLTEYH